ncbi:MAG: hypothetical protein ACE5LL_08925 [Alphaproteobacteria bacterium]
MVVGRILGWALVVFALAAAVVEIIGLIHTGSYDVLAAGEFWSRLNANSLVGFGAFVEQTISPALWFDVFLPLLGLPTWLVLGLPGGVLAVVFRARRQRRRRRGSFPR